MSEATILKLANMPSLHLNKLWIPQSITFSEEDILLELVRKQKFVSFKLPQYVSKPFARIDLPVFKEMTQLQHLSIAANVKISNSAYSN